MGGDFEEEALLGVHLGGLGASAYGVGEGSVAVRLATEVGALIGACVPATGP